MNQISRIIVYGLPDGKMIGYLSNPYFGINNSISQLATLTNIGINIRQTTKTFTYTLNTTTECMRYYRSDAIPYINNTLWITSHITYNITSTSSDSWNMRHIFFTSNTDTDPTLRWNGDVSGTSYGCGIIDNNTSYIPNSYASNGEYSNDVNNVNNMVFLALFSEYEVNIHAQFDITYTVYYIA